MKPSFKGREAIVNDKPVNEYFLTQKASANLNLCEVPGVLKAENYGFAIRKGDDKLRARLDKVLDEIRADGTYDKIYAKAYAEETALIDGLLLDLAKADVAEALKTLRLDTYVAQLKTLNDAYKALDITRTDEYAARVKTDTTKARKATDETLDLIIQRINAYAVLEPTEAINAFIDTVNQIFRKYKNLIAAKGGPTSPSKPDDKPYPTPDPTPDPENPGGDSESPDEI